MERIKQNLARHPQNSLAKFLLVAGEAALQAGAIVRQLYGKPHQIRYKGEIDIVTEADLAAEEAILQILARKTPGVEVLAEESRADYRSIPEGPLWIVDPLDGTTNFAHGFPYFGTSIAYAENGKVLAGVIVCPIQNELFWASQNNGAWLNGQQIKVTATSDLRKSLVATGFPYNIQDNLTQVVDSLKNVLQQVQDIRRAGAAAIDLAYLACGRLDGFWEMDLQPWDTAAGQILVEEAGGRLTNFNNEPFSPFFPEVIASNAIIHSSLSELIGGQPLARA